MKKLLILLALFTGSKATDIVSIDSLFDDVLKKDDSLVLKLIKPMEYKKTQNNAHKKFLFNLESSCIECYGKNFYDAKAGVRFIVNSVLGLETGYQLVHSRLETFDDLKMDSENLGLYGRLVLKF